MRDRGGHAGKSARRVFEYMLHRTSCIFRLFFAYAVRVYAAVVVIAYIVVRIDYHLFSRPPPNRARHAAWAKLGARLQPATQNVRGMAIAAPQRSANAHRVTFVHVQNNGKSSHELGKHNG